MPVKSDYNSKSENEERNLMKYSEASVERISGDRLFLCLIGEMPYSHFSQIKRK